jgi:hypothetical protein
MPIESLEENRCGFRSGNATKLFERVLAIKILREFVGNQPLKSCDLAIDFALPWTISLAKKVKESHCSLSYSSRNAKM